MKLTKNFIQPIAGAMLCIFLFSCGGKNAQNGSGMVREYAVMTLQPDSMEWYSNYPAAIKGKRDIEIRPNVSGFITDLRVDEGSVVRKGQVLFVIDTVPYKAALKVAETNVEVAKASTETARLTVENKRELQRRDIISEYDLQMAENSYASAKAQLAQAEAQLVNARNNDSYTRVISPLDGVGEIPFRVGSLVSPSSATPLTTVSDNSEMYVYFSMTERQILELVAQYGAENFLQKLPTVSLKLSDGSIYPLKGRIETVSGIIDTQTGSSNMRATFENPNRLLRSGGSGVIMIPMKNDHAILVPQKATYEIQDKKFVYVLNDDSTVTSTEITIASIDNGKEYMVTSGLKAGDRIVTEGVNTLKDGMTIKAAGSQNNQ